MNPLPSKYPNLESDPIQVASDAILTVLPFTIGYLICLLSLNYLWILIPAILLVVFKRSSFLSHERRAIEEVMQKYEITAVKVPDLKSVTSDLKTSTLAKGTNETVNWINQLMVQMWPYVTDYMEKMMKAEVEHVLHTFRVTVVSVSLGTKTPEVSNIVCDEKDPKNQDVIRLMMDVM